LSALVAELPLRDEPLRLLEAPLRPRDEPLFDELLRAVELFRDDALRELELLDPLVLLAWGNLSSYVRAGLMTRTISFPRGLSKETSRTARHGEPPAADVG
jgi:hypothetical protein